MSSTEVIASEPTVSYVQYLRDVRLFLGNDQTGQWLDLSQMHIKFSTQQFTKQTPSSAQIRVFNLSEDTMHLIESEFTQVILQAGYVDGNVGQIHKGELVQVRRGRENPVDTYLDLTSATDDAALNWAIISTSAHAGSSFRQRAEVVSQWMKLPIGWLDEPSSGSGNLPRGYAKFGMAKDYTRDLAAASDTDWFTQDGKLYMVKARGGFVPGDIVVLNAATGLIGFPEQSHEGITVKCLLNPKLAMGGRIKIDNADITLAAISLGYTEGAQNSLLQELSKGDRAKNEDGLYRIIVLAHTGDTRGQEYYSTMTCIALTSTVPLPKDLVEQGYSRGF